MPNTKPDLTFDSEGLCSGCSSFLDRPNINWDERYSQLEQLVKPYKDSGTWDCVIPVSGGKDSTFQVLKALELGLNPLAVTATTCDLSGTGRRNLENISKLGVDHIEMTSNRVVRAKLNRLMLERVGDISWPEHIGIFSIPVRVAVTFRIPLIIWGENSQNEYGGPDGTQDAMVLDRNWLEEFGGLLGQRLSDLVDEGQLSAAEAEIFSYPAESELEDVGVKGIFLGHFLPWDGFRTALLSTAHGFESSPKPHGGGLLNYENLDNRQTAIHDYFKYLKYGFGRVTDHVCMQIRRNRLTRAEGLAIVKLHDGRFPQNCIDDDLDSVLGRIGVTRSQFDAIADNFTNSSIFESTEEGLFARRSDGSPRKILEESWGQ